MTIHRLINERAYGVKCFVGKTQIGNVAPHTELTRGNAELVNCLLDEMEREIRAAAPDAAS